MKSSSTHEWVAYKPLYTAFHYFIDYVQNNTTYSFYQTNEIRKKKS